MGISVYAVMVEHQCEEDLGYPALLGMVTEGEIENTKKVLWRLDKDEKVDFYEAGVEFDFCPWCAAPIDYESIRDALK